MRALAVLCGLSIAASMPIDAAVARAASAREPAINQAAFNHAVADTKAAMMADPSSALAGAKRVEAIARKDNDPRSAREELATAKWLEGEALSRVNKPAQALPVINQAYALATAIAPNTKLQADIVLARAIAEIAIGDVRSALDDHQHAYKLYAQLGEGRGQAKALIGIAGIFSDAGDLDRALHYYSLVPDVYRGDPAIDLAAFNNRGETLKKLGRYAEAQGDYRRALVAARQMGSTLLQARILTNLATAQLLGGSSETASHSANAALTLTSTSEAAGWRPFVWGVMAQIALARGNVDQARALIDKTFAGVDIASSPLPFRDFHQTAFEIYSKLGQFEPALSHHVNFKRLDDDARKLTASMSAALTSARFDFTNQNLKIAKLRSERAQRDAQLVQTKAHLRTVVLTTLLVTGTGLLAMLSLAFISIRRSRNKERRANAELSISNVSLEQALKVKTEFLATTSHEIRTPLNGILGMTQVLLADHRLDAGVRDRIKVVHGAGETMRALVDDILDIAKIESGKLTVEKAPMDLRQLLTQVAQLWRDQAEVKNLRLEVDIADAPKWINADEARLRQIVFNLMSNAVKFTASGSISLGTICARGDTTDRLDITVRDTGIGIPLAQQAVIFESFRQADGGINRQFGGTGLGLAICRQLARAMGGDVTVVSEPGAGSTFVLSLPIELADQSPAAEPVPGGLTGPVVRLSDARLLVLESNPLTQRVMQRLLEPVAGSFAVVGDSEMALAAMTSHAGPIHLLAEAASSEATDLGEFSVLTRLCATAHAKGGLVSVLFAPGAELTAASLASVGADHLIQKPITGTCLIATLQSLYERSVQAIEIARAA